MKLLFVHQNFPAQYRWLAETLARDTRCRAMALSDATNLKRSGGLPGVEVAGYSAPAGASSQTHHYVRSLEGAVRRGQAVARACLELKKRGFVPDVVCAHPAWGEALFLKDVFPDARLILYCEFYYRAQGADVGFDPEFPATLDDLLRLRIRNAASLLSLEHADAGVSPTEWQRAAFPGFFRERIAVAHEGVDTDRVKPDPGAELVLEGRNVKLTPADEVVTYIARNLEPYRGFHSFMRALPEIQRRRPRAHVLIVGADGVSYGKSPPRGQTYRKLYLEELGKSLDLGRVHFLGRVPHETLVRIYQVSSAHVYLTYPFVLSWSLIEAMAAGCAVVASRTAPVQEVIADGENGFLADFFKPREIAERVDEVMDRPRGSDTVRERARKTIVERYDLKAVCLPRHLKLLGITQTKP